MQMKKFNLLLILGIVLISLSFASALNISTDSYSVNSTHLGLSGTGNISTTNYQARDTITYQQAGTRNVQTISYTANSGWFSVATQAVGSVNITNIFFSNESVFNYSNVFNSSEIVYDMNLSYIGANCTPIQGSVSNVTFSLFNTEDNITYVNETGYTYSIGSLYILNASYQIRDSGNWTLNVSCYASSGGLIDRDASLWEIAWGTVVVNLINPAIDTLVQIYEFFTFSANVTCSGGECGIVNVTLDPEEVDGELCEDVETCENVTITNCVNETIESCDEDCSIEESENCEEITTDNCIGYEMINGTETDNCLEYEIIKDCSIEEIEVCEDIAPEGVLSSESNCTEEILESCEDIIEENCIINTICEEDEQEDEVNPPQIPENESEDEGEEGSEFEHSPQAPLLEEDEMIGAPQAYPETFPDEMSTGGKEFKEGEILETEEGKDLGEKIEDELEYETHFLEMEQTEEEFRIVFYHDYNGTLPIRINGEVNYTLAPLAYPEKSSTKIFTRGNKIEADYLENVTLVVELINGILPKFELHIGEESEIFEFGKVIPIIELKQGNYTLIDRDDLKLDVQIEFDSEESIILRGLEDEENINVTLGTNSQEDVSSSIIAVPSLNIENATIVLEKTKGVNAIISCEDSDFDYENLECSDWKYANVDFVEENETIEFNVEHFTAYAGGNLTAGETAFLTIWDYNDVGMPNASINTTDIKIANETIQFFADYELAANGTKLSGGNCIVVFSDNSSNALNMSYNSTYEFFLYERNFTSNGAYTYTVNCTHASYVDLSESDSIVIGQFSNQTKGAVSTEEGAVPFYTTSANPANCTLKGGESCDVTWEVNATGILDKVYDFFVEVIGIFMPYTTSSHVNLTITANDSTVPVFVSTIASPSAVINGSDVTINANVNDNVQVDSIWANITLPDNSSQFISAGLLPYIYTTSISQIGVHTVTYYANDSSGNNATATKTFQVAGPANMSMNVSVEVGVSVNVTSDVDLIVYAHGTNNEITRRNNINGTESILLPNVPLDLFFNTTFGNNSRSTKINNLNLSQSTGGEISFSNPTVSGYLTVYAVNTSFTFDNATVEINYNNSGYSDESNLQLHKCDNFDMATEICLGTWEDKTNEVERTTWDTDNDKFIYVTDSFSGFGIKQYVPPVTTSPTGGGGRSIIIPPVEEPEEIEEEIPEQLFDITFNLDDKLIQSVNELSGIVTFESFGNVPTPVGLTFIILDSSGKEIYREMSSITVTTEELLRWNYETLQTLPEGKYTAVLETLYNVDVYDKFTQEFEIGEEKKLGVWIWYVVVVVVVILIIGLVWWLVKIKKKKIKRKSQRSFIKGEVKKISGVKIGKPKKYN